MDIREKLKNVLKLALEQLQGENAEKPVIEMAASMKTIGGDVVFTNSDAFNSGVEVFIQDVATGEQTALIAGTYEMEDGSKLTVVNDGILDSVSVGEIDVTEKVVEEVVAEAALEVDERDEKIASLEAKITQLESMITDNTKTEDVILKMSKVIEDLSKPAVESVLELSKQEREKIALEAEALEKLPENKKRLNAYRQSKNK
jgi:hypothetical protein